MAPISPPVFALAAAILAAIIIYRAIWTLASPLSKIPNAGFGAAYSRFAWAFPHEYQGTVTIDLPKLHEKLGPLIRIGPAEVSFYSRDTYETVHKVGSKFKKDPRVYGEFIQDGHPALFSLTDPDQHSKRRRIMGQLFSRSKITQLEGLIFAHVDRFVNKIHDSGPAVDLMAAARALEADIISEFSFGKPIQAIDAWADGQELAMVAKNDEKATWMPVLTSFPLACELWEQFAHRLFFATGLRTSYTKGLTENSWKLTLSAAPESESSATSFPNLIRTLVHSGLPSETALSEAKENLGPGTDTTSATLGHILWALAHNPRYQNALYQDLAAVSFATDMKTLEYVPRLQACVKEGIRWAAAAAAMLPRIVPLGGIELHGTFIPEGTVLTSSPIWYLHDKTAFPNPELYDPYRWLTSDGQAMSENALRDRFYIPFSRGANICMGAHFAYLELYLSISQVIRNFHLHPNEPSKPAHVCADLLLGNEDAHSWTPVPLPRRREWVAAVPVDQLKIKMSSRL
ncbi:cytochrome P450 [Thelonectria olida]|uniref:Cytochrome P450 n=1 Tax=Thelonectria olida TaxID=1576542 RepID=A0A9P8VYJ9_9HYPO|nr:cytochrome P450 [Thelonectria olida]